MSEQACTPCETCGGDQSRGWHLHGFSPAQVASLEREAYLHSDELGPGWIAGWHAAVDHVTTHLARVFSTDKVAS